LRGPDVDETGAETPGEGGSAGAGPPATVIVAEGEYAAVEECVGLIEVTIVFVGEFVVVAAAIVREAGFLAMKRT